MSGIKGRTGVYIRTKKHRDATRYNGFKKGHKKFGTGTPVGFKFSKETKRRHSEDMKQRWANPKMRKKMIEGRMGHYVSDKTKQKLSGRNHWNWQGGKTYESYTVDWTKTLKRSIRERDNYICQVCSKQQEDETFDVHHIDYDKKNSSSNNLITLCASCHTKTNGNRRQWTKYFKGLNKCHI